MGIRGAIAAACVALACAAAATPAMAVTTDASGEVVGEYVMTKAAWDETVVDKAAWDEAVVGTRTLWETERFGTTDAATGAITYHTYDFATEAEAAQYSKEMGGWLRYSSKSIPDNVAWDQAAIATHLHTLYVASDGYTTDSGSDIGNYCALNGLSYHAENVPPTVSVTHHDAVTKTVHHDAVTHVVHHAATYGWESGVQSYGGRTYYIDPATHKAVRSSWGGTSDELDWFGTDGAMTSSPQVRRLWGDVALDTMRSIIDSGFPSTGGTVVLATSGGYWDALSASSAAGAASAPIVLTDGNSLSDQARAELRRLRPRTLVVCGGTAALTDATASAAASAAGGAGVVRCAGATATGTAVALARETRALGGTSTTALVCTSDGYWDALSAAPYAYARRCPILLTEPDGTLGPETLSAMRSLGITSAYVVGGTAAVPSGAEAQLAGAGVKVSGRLAGDDAIDTSRLVAEFGLARGMSAAHLSVATSEGYWDALTGAALCGSQNSVLVLASASDTSAVTAVAGAHGAGVTSAHVFGGTAAVSDAVMSAFARAIRS